MADEPENRHSDIERSVIRRLAAMTWTERDAFYANMSRQDTESAISEIMGQPPSPPEKGGAHDRSDR